MNPQSDYRADRSGTKFNVIIKPGGLITLAVLVAVVVSTIAFLISRLHERTVGSPVGASTSVGHDAVVSPADVTRVNGSFERVSAVDPSTAEGWEKSSVAGYSLDSSVFHSGHLSIRCDNDQAVGNAGSRYRLFLYQTTPRPVEITAWSKARNVTGQTDWDYSLCVETEFMDGTYEWGRNAAFSVGTHDWEQKSIVINPKKPIRHCKIYMLFRKAHQGTAWFDDVSFKTLGDAG